MKARKFSKKAEKQFEVFELLKGQEIKTLFARNYFASCLGVYSPLAGQRAGIFWGLRGFYLLEPGLKMKPLSNEEGLALARKLGHFETVEEIIKRIKDDAKRIKLHQVR